MFNTDRQQTKETRNSIFGSLNSGTMRWDSSSGSSQNDSQSARIDSMCSQKLPETKDA